MDSSSLYITIVLSLGIVAQVVSWRLGIPSILLLLVFGFGLGHFYLRPDEVLGEPLLFSLVGLSVAVILFLLGRNGALRPVVQSDDGIDALGCKIVAFVPPDSK